MLESNPHLLLIFSVVLLNKTDLVSEKEVKKIQAAVKTLNAKANIYTTQHSKVELKRVMKTQKFDFHWGCTVKKMKII